MNLAARARMAGSARDRQDFWCLTGAIAMVGLALGTLLPLTALQLNAAGLGSATIGLIVSVHAFGLVLAIFICEHSTRVLGARKTIECSGVAAAAIAVLMQGLQGPLALAVALFFLGVLLGVVFNMVESWVNEVVPEAQRGFWLAVHCTLFTLFQLSGPLIVQFAPTQYAFVVSAGLMLLAWPIYRMLSTRQLGIELDAVQESRVPWGQYLLSAPVVAVGTALFALFDTIVLSLLPIYGLAQGMDTASALVSASVVLAGDTSLEVVVGALADRMGRARVHALCAIGLMGASALLPFSIGTVFWWPLLFAMGGAAGGIYVLAMMACGQRFRGKHLLRMTALMGSVWGVASIAGPLVTGSLMSQNSKWSIPAVVFFMAACLAASLAYEKFRKFGPHKDFSHA